MFVSSAPVSAVQSVEVLPRGRRQLYQPQPKQPDSAKKDANLLYVPHAYSSPPRPHAVRCMQCSAKTMQVS